MCKLTHAYLLATMIAAQTIQSGTQDIVVAGGMESMSNAPKYLVGARSFFPFSTVYNDLRVVFFNSVFVGFVVFSVIELSF